MPPGLVWQGEQWTSLGDNMAADSREREELVQINPSGGGEVADRTRIVLRPLASPMPLGFFAFGVGIALTSLLDLGVFAQPYSHQVAVLLLAFTAPLELLAAVFAMLARDPGAGTALAVLGATWISTGVGMLLAPPGTTSPVSGAFAICLTAVLLVLAAAASQGKPALAILLGLSTLRFLANGIHELLDSRPWATAAGALGMLIAAFSVYGGLALLLEDSLGRTVLPTGRRGRARDSIEGGFAAQLAQLETEAGVRNQL